MTNTVAVQAAATSAQLKAEIAGSEFRSVRQLAVVMDEDYTTMTKWVNGKTPIRLEMLFRILEQIGVNPAEFFTNVQARVSKELARD